MLSPKINNATVQIIKDKYLNGLENFKKSIGSDIIVYDYSIGLIAKKESTLFEREFLTDMKNSLGYNPSGKIKTNPYVLTVLDEDPEKLAEIFIVAYLDYYKKIEPETVDNLLNQIETFFELCIQQIPYVRKLLSKKSSKKGDLGSYAFPQSRKNDFLPLEKDTYIEEDIYTDLDSHFNNSTSMGNKESLAIQKFLANNEYHDVFKEPNVKTVYRGMGVSSTWLKNVLNDQYDDNAYSGKINKSFVFNPLHNSQGSTSWTSDKNVAEEFAMHGSINNLNSDIKIVLIAKTAENRNKFLACKDGLYKLSATQGLEHEKEIVGLGPINISSVEWKVS